MKLKRAKFRGFGKWVDREFQFHDGINLIEAKNEAGKSTLVHGIYALLFGSKKEGLRVRREAEWYPIYYPWLGQEYGGEIEYELKKRRYRLIRNLKMEEDFAQLIDLKTGRDLTEQFPLDKKRDRNFIESQTGISGEIYRKIAYLTSGSFLVREKRKEEDAASKRMVDKMTQLLKQGAEMDLSPVIQYFDHKIQEIGKTEQAKQKPLGIHCKWKEDLEKQIRSLENVRDELALDEEYCEQLLKKKEQWNLERAKILAQLEKVKEKIKSSAEQELDLHKFETLTAEYQLWRNKQKDLNDIIHKLEKWKDELAKLTPPHLVSKEEFAQLQMIQKEIEEHEEKLAELEQKLAEWREQREKLTADFQKVSFFDEGEASFQLAKLREFEELEQKHQVLSQSLIDSASQLQQLEMDLEQLANWQKEKQAIQERQDFFHKEWRQISMREAETIEDRKQMYWLSALAGSVILAIVSSFFWFPALFIWLGVSGFFYFQYSQHNSAIRSLRKKWNNKKMGLQQRIEELEKEKEVILKKEQAIFQNWQVDSLLQMYQKREEMRQMDPHLADGLREEERLAKQMEKIIYDVKQWLSQFFEEIPPFSVASWRQLIYGLQMKKEEIKQMIQKLDWNLQNAEAEFEKGSLEKQQLVEELKAELAKYGTDDWELLQDWLIRSEQIQQLKWKIQEAEEQKEELLLAAKYENWDEKIASLREERESIYVKWIGSFSMLSEANQNWYHQKERLEKQLAEIVEQDKQFDLELKILEGKIAEKQEKLDQLKALETEWKMVENKIQELLAEREAYELAKQVLLETAKELQEDLAPKLIPKASHWIYTMTSQRYESILIDPSDGFRLSVFVPETGERKEVESLSTGTIDQMYLALRVALVQFHSETTNMELPIIFDDCFVHFDQERLRQALRLIHEISKKHQVFLCSCQSREREIFESEGIPYTPIQLV